MLFKGFFSKTSLQNLIEFIWNVQWNSMILVTENIRRLQISFFKNFLQNSLFSSQRICSRYGVMSEDDLKFCFLSLVSIQSGEGAGSVGTAMVGPKSFRLHLNDTIYCFKNNDAYCLNTIAGPIINYFLRHRIIVVTIAEHACDDA